MKWLEKIGNRKRHGGFRIASDDLLTAIAASETEYLTFGRGLQALHEKAEGVSRASSTLAGLSTGEQLKNLRGVLEEAFEEMGGFGMGSGQGTQALASILEKAGAMEKDLSTFRNVVKALEVLCNFIRIESARLGTDSTAFDALAENVSKLGKSIHNKSSALLQHAGALSTLARANLEKIRDFEQARMQSGTRIRRSIQRFLDELNEQSDSSSLKLKRIETASEEITASIGGIVGSLQFHDISRQRIEHVTDALGKISPDGSGNGVGVRSPGIPKFFRRFKNGNGTGGHYKIFRLQRAQLLHTRGELASAARRIVESLQGVAAGIKEVSREAQEARKGAGGASTSFFSEMKEEILRLTDALGEYERMNQEIVSAVEQFDGAVSMMRGFLDEIVKIGIEMKMVALNAAIHAAHVGEAGLALGVLADHIHGLSQETSGRIQAVEGELRSIFEYAHQLKDFAASATGRRSDERARTIENLQQVVPSLGKLNSESMLLLEHIERDGGGLSTGIRESASRAHFHEGILQGIDGLVAAIDRECETMERSVDRASLRDGAWGGAGDLEELARTYTMQRERDVHESAFAPPDGDIEKGLEMVAAAGGEGKKKDELGENVELF